ncbi:hypothetical protein [Deinococcus radiotolerans]|uniref:Uncharacterized protein n=1 Tax=Deinococcus radiotolerans TaxID=1309407 RepID=A0ABQ2FNZ7_9DEIO|nr:hypothetical protein [Deinococcus radiotolerans]GGL12821.1 hypothetical protein GCM10010844_34430 [Deinococcus radiotolerans]
MNGILDLRDAPEFHKILLDFAHRLEPESNGRDVVLASVFTTLRYRDGRDFRYSLDPANFQVEEYDSLVRAVSPINQSSQARRLAYRVRDIEGFWHSPIGTTGIWKDILGLEERDIPEAEKTILESIYQVKQHALLQQHGDDFRAYGAANGLPEGMMTSAYLNRLDTRDPIREHLRALLNGRVPFTRHALKLLRAHAKGWTAHQTEHDQDLTSPKGAHVDVTPRHPHTPIWVTTPAHPPRRRELSAELVESLRPQRTEIMNALPAALQPEAHELFSSLSVEPRCSPTLLATLRDITGEELNERELAARKSAMKRDEVWVTTMVEHWDLLALSLNELQPLRKTRLKEHLTRQRLLPTEWSLLREAWKAATATLDQDTLAAQALPLSIADQRYWHTRRFRLQLHLTADQADLVGRLEEKTLLNMDLPALRTAHSLDKDSMLTDIQIHELRQRHHLIDAVPPEYRDAFRRAVADNNFQPQMRQVLARLASRLNLELETLQAPTLPEDMRSALFHLWAYIAPQVPEMAGALYTALKKGRYTLKEADTLKALATTPLPNDVLPEEARALLLHFAHVWSHNALELREAVEHKRYTPLTYAQLVRHVRDVEIMVQNARTRQQDEERQAALTRQQDREVAFRSAVDLCKQLMARWKAWSPADAQAMLAVQPAELLTCLPHVCGEFQINNKRISLKIEKAVRDWMSARSAGVTGAPS